MIEMIRMRRQSSSPQKCGFLSTPSTTRKRVATKTWGFAPIILAAFILLPQNAFALPVTVDVGSYLGFWSVDGGPDNLGTKSMDLAVGFHDIGIGDHDSFEIEVLANGDVIVTNPASATGGSGSLLFNTASIFVLTNLYQGLWKIDGAHPEEFRFGSTVTRLVPGIRYFVRIGTEDGVFIELDNLGLAISDNSDAIMSFGTQIIFMTQQVFVDPGLYEGSWRVSQARPDEFVTGPFLTDLVTAIDFRVDVGNIGSFNISVDPTGVVTTENTAAANGGQNELTFNTEEFNIVPEDGINWRVVEANPNTMTGGILATQLVPGLDYEIEANVGGGNETLAFSIDASCAVNPGELNFSFGDIEIFCGPIPEPTPDCEIKEDYESRYCRGLFIARSSQDLEDYANNNFSSNDKYFQHLIVAFDTNDDDLEIHSPCSIVFPRKSKISGQNICIDGRYGVFVGKKSRIEGEDVKLLSGSSVVFVGSKTSVDADDVEVKGKYISGFLGKSRVNTGNLNLSTNGISYLGRKNRIEATELVSVESTSQSNFGNAIIIGQQKVISAPEFSANANRCYISRKANIQADSKTGSCF